MGKKFEFLRVARVKSQISAFEMRKERKTRVILRNSLKDARRLHVYVMLENCGQGRVGGVVRFARSHLYGFAEWSGQLAERGDQGHSYGGGGGRLDPPSRQSELTKLNSE